MGTTNRFSHHLGAARQNRRGGWFANAAVDSSSASSSSSSAANVVTYSDITVNGRQFTVFVPKIDATIRGVVDVINDNGSSDGGGIQTINNNNGGGGKDSGVYPADTGSSSARLGVAVLGVMSDATEPRPNGASAFAMPPSAFVVVGWVMFVALIFADCTA